MIYRIYWQKDSTIYENNIRKAQNTGLDEILEVTKIFSEDGSTFIGNSRILTQFDLAEISKSIADGTITGTPFTSTVVVALGALSFWSNTNLNMSPSWKS